MLQVVHLLSVIHTICPAHFHFALVRYWTVSVSVTLVLCLIILQIKSFSLTFTSIFHSMACWLVSSFFTCAFVRDRVWHPYVITGKTYWFKNFLFILMGRCLFRKISLYFPKTLDPAFSVFHSYQNFLPCSVSVVIVCSTIFIVSPLVYFCPVYFSICVCCLLCQYSS